MSKNERTQTYIKNKNELLDIIIDLSDNYSNYNKIYIKNLLNLKSFYENLSLVLESLPSKIIFPKIETITLLNNNPSINIINNFYIFHKNFLNNLHKLSMDIKQKIIPKLTDYKINLETENTNIKFFMDDLIRKINDHQAKINEYNNNIKSESEKLKKMEIDSLKKLRNTSMLEIIHKTLDDQRKKVTNYSVIHFQEIQSLNKLYNEKQDEMVKKIYQIKSNYKNNNYVIFESIKNYINIWNDNVIDSNVNESKKLYEQIEVVEENLNPDYFTDIILVNENKKAIFYNKWKYNQINNNVEIINNENDDDNNNPHLLRIPKIPYTDIKYDPEYMLIFKESNFDSDSQDKNYKNNNLNQQNMKNSDFLSNFFLSLRKNNNINAMKLSDVVNLLEQKTGKLNFYHEFCDIYLLDNKKEIYSLFDFVNFTNLAHVKTFFNNILENISINIKNKSIDSFALLDKIIIIGEKSLFDNTFLCSLLKKNKIFNDKNIWEDCIKFKVIDLLNEICNQGSSKNLLNEGLKLYNKGSKIIGGFFGIENKKITKKDNIVEYLGLMKYLPKYNDLSEDKKIIINKNQAPIIIHDVFKIYIRHMSNYGYNIENSINVIYDIYNYFQFNDNDIINYYLTYNNICGFSCKNKTLKFDLNTEKIKNKEKIKQKIRDIKNRQINSIKYPTKLRNEKSKIIILKNIAIFLEDKEKIKLITLSKKIKNKISRKIYNYKLKQKNTSVSTHIQIWKIYLDLKTLKENKKTYINSLKNIDKPEIKERHQKTFKIIEVDVSRTEFLKNKQKGKTAVNNILKALQLYNLENNYCQGMNYMAAFLYENTLNEEDSYYLILGLFINKNFSSIFRNGMTQLKNYFVIMERLIYLFLPKIYSHFKINQVMPDFFLSPFFITLFTHIYPTCKEKNNIFILRIWDEFIINGWKSVFEAILTLLKLKEKNILSCQGDELVDFLVNKINKDSVFLNKNYEKFEKMKKYFVINNDLMKNLEEEIIIENKLKKKNQTIMI